MTSRLIICDTCKREGHQPLDGKTCGEQLADLILAKQPNLTVEKHSCLMGCERACNIALQEDGKLSYVLGTFDPTEEAADGIIEYALMYQDAENGRVPYKQWPQAVKGHFVARIPPRTDG